MRFLSNLGWFFFLFAAVMLYSERAQAHFQLLYTPQVNLSRVASLPMRLVFAHPMANGHVMSMGKPEQFYYRHKGKQIDLLDRVRPITWAGPDNHNGAYAAEVKIKRNGDYPFVLVPAPYYEKSEDIYIQQWTKSFVNKGGIPSGWEKPLGLKTEIVPLNKPTNIIVGSTFSGMVQSQGQPVAGAEVEVEWINGQPDLQRNGFGPSRITSPPATLVAITDANGVFTFGIPRAGHWGFAALGVGPDKQYQKKELSQDAVLWIYASELK
ncbi:DUF4198 domain-containing protein [Magnetococcus sp. PR-3]|uniref:DUF4198 domain-containing protein n=1 Tax=Magnetococcus sp. PR-3 TaxID=3120355 RepID=UPI002FCDEBE0